MQTFNILLTSTPINNLDVSANFSAAYWATLLGQLSSGVELALNPTAGDVTLTGVLSQYLSGAPLVIRNAQPLGGHNVLCPATDPASQASAQFAQNFVLMPGAQVALLFNPDKSGMWSAEILLPNGHTEMYLPGEQQIVEGLNLNGLGVGAYIVSPQYALGVQGSVPGGE